MVVEHQDKHAAEQLQRSEQAEHNSERHHAPKLQIFISILRVLLVKISGETDGEYQN